MLHHEAITPGGPGHYGMVLMAGNYRRKEADIGPIVTAVATKLEQFPGETDLIDGEIWL